MVLSQGSAKVSLYTGVHYSPNQLAEFHLDVGRKGIGAVERGEEGEGGLTEVRREEEQRERWSVFLMESDRQGGGRDNNTEKTLSCAHSPARSLSHACSFCLVAVKSPMRGPQGGLILMKN